MVHIKKKKKKALRNKTKKPKAWVPTNKQGGTTLKMFFTYNFGKDNKDRE